jgi:hypothetical protein
LRDRLGDATMTSDSRRWRSVLPIIWPIFSLASVLWYEKDFDSFRDAAERAVLLNPMDGNSVAYMGELLTYTRQRGAWHAAG